MTTRNDLASWSIRPMFGCRAAHTLPPVSNRRYEMYVVVQHQIQQPETAFARGEKLKLGEGAPAGARALQFYPSTDGSTVVCLWEAGSVADVQQFCDTTLGDSSINTSYEVDSGHAFSDRPLGLPATPAIAA